MASISIPCPKCSAAARGVAPRRSAAAPMSSVLSVSDVRSLVIAGSGRFPLSQGHEKRRFPILKAQVQEVAVDVSTNSLPAKSTKSESLSSDTNYSEALNKSSAPAPVPDSTISAFMAEVSNLVKLVDSKDVTELMLKHNDCEIVIRKKEALPIPAVSPIVMQHPQAMFPTQPSYPQAIPPPPPASASTAAPAAAPALPPPTAKKGSSSSLPPLKCPMAGTFYQSPAPGEPPFVKVGDKVQKGQVVCIIEAMKLMNEIEADQSGTVVEILAEDGKPVSIDMPLLIIQP
ncbi:biotin carboxyl carrier protein of acetyl-CoA carboxylase, chloroplastic-like [Ananas comosus]|uniref:Biotin carboxyl carrier protein of acetyl-CoA carboxylase n=1 Tax=Ananas comosus TaxID=4615 RepID=A0A199V7G3_ANACO|nr:biotin carboxyl carrier protein of acetyl-CoA carboxylase, chloroplastic-like [Ananas comosus]OAY72770.1 Biotin carboxyl carrier protein of acetyl-CoA carboxylase 1, chloroplastic [Ananas comosus]